jgi:hypothetical protein
VDVGELFRAGAGSDSGRATEGRGVGVSLGRVGDGVGWVGVTGVTWAGVTGVACALVAGWTG